MKAPHLYLALSLSLGSLCLANTDLYAPDIADWQNMVWLDSAGRPQTLEAGYTVTLGKEAAGSSAVLPEYKIRFSRSVSTGEIYFGERADWHLLGEGITLLAGEGPIFPMGKLNIGLNLVMRNIRTSEGNELLIGSQGSVYAMTLLAEGGLISFDGGACEIYHIELLKDAKLSIRGNAHLKFKEISMSKQSRLELAGMSLSSDAAGEQNHPIITAESGDDHLSNAVRGRCFTGVKIRAAQLQVGADGGALENSSIADSRVEVMAEGSLLQLSQCDLSFSTLIVADGGELEAEYLIWKTAVSQTTKITPKRHGKPLPAVIVNGMEIGEGKSRIKGDFILDLVAQEQADDVLREYLNGGEAAILLQGVARGVLSSKDLTIIVNISNKQYETKECFVQSIDQDGDGNVVLILKKS